MTECWKNFIERWRAVKHIMIVRKRDSLTRLSHFPCVIKREIGFSILSHNHRANTNWNTSQQITSHVLVVGTVGVPANNKVETFKQFHLLLPPICLKLQCSSFILRISRILSGWTTWIGSFIRFFLSPARLASLGNNKTQHNTAVVCGEKVEWKKRKKCWVEKLQPVDLCMAFRFCGAGRRDNNGLVKLDYMFEYENRKC